jgi:hypothetical protein
LLGICVEKGLCICFTNIATYEMDHERDGFSLPRPSQDVTCS